MKIKKITYQSRRDFLAIYECEHCGYVSKDEKEFGWGYDDRNFHDNVISDFECPKCHKKADKDYRGLQTKYPEGMQV